jgi:hypothetical protein
MNSCNNIKNSIHNDGGWGGWGGGGGGEKIYIAVISCNCVLMQCLILKIKALISQLNCKLENEIKYL